MVNPLNNLLTPEQISKKLKVSIFTVYRWIKSGKLKAIKLTPRVFRIEEKELKTFLNKRKTK
jgi:excisionase family DNA binding protein